jgi:hypothetical protein
MNKFKNNMKKCTISLAIFNFPLSFRGYIAEECLKNYIIDEKTATASYIMQAQKLVSTQWHLLHIETAQLFLC